MHSLLAIYAATVVCIWTGVLLVIGIAAWIKERWFQ